MSKAKSVFACQACGYHTPKWLGRCPDCGAWNTLSEEPHLTSRRSQQSAATQTQLPLSLPQVARSGEERLLTGIGELDRVLGGGVVNGSLVLVGGDPGIGKSTLLLQAAAGLSRRLSDAGADSGVLYVSGEESASQLRMRSDRLGADYQHIYILTETSIELIREQVTRLRPRAGTASRTDCCCYHRYAAPHGQARG